MGMPPMPSRQEQQEQPLTREGVVAAFRALHEKGIRDPEDTRNLEVDAAQDLFVAWQTQVSAAEKPEAAGRSPEALLESARRSLEASTVLLDAGFSDPKVNGAMLDERAEWLMQAHEDAEGAGAADLARTILAVVHRIDDILGRKHFDPGEGEPSPQLRAPERLRTPSPEELERSKEAEKRENIRAFVRECNVFFPKEGDPKPTPEQITSAEMSTAAFLVSPDALRDLTVNGAMVSELTNNLPSRGYVDAKRGIRYVFIKLTPEVSLYGETHTIAPNPDSLPLIPESVKFVDTAEARRTAMAFEARRDMKKDHAS